jgi:hypothetical protein
MFYYWIVDSNTRNPQNIISYNIKYMDNSVHFFSNLELHVFIIREDEKKGRGGKEPPTKEDQPIHKTLCKSALHDRIFDKRSRTCLHEILL